MPAAGRGTPGGAKAHQCPDCDKTFSRKEYVLRHARLVHQGDRPFRCSCDASFARSDLLKRHERTCKKIKDEDVSPPAAGPSTGYYMQEPAFPPLPELPDPRQHQHYSYPPLASSSSSFSVPPLPSLSPQSATDSLAPPETPPTPYGVSPPSTEQQAHHQAPVYDYGPLSLPHGQDQTLAPFFSRSFSQDEITATEVLEDLLRSPPSFMHHHPAPYVEQAAEETKTWHDTVAAPALSDVSSSAINPETWGMMYEGGDQGIENSPAALALADYFNKGGVGGITALDLGFTLEPTMFPDHLFEPQIVHDDTDMRFWIPNQKFCIGYLFPWAMPKMDKMMEYGKKAAEHLLPSVPVIHPGTLSMNDMSVATSFALTVAGAAYTPGGEGFSNEMLVEKRVFLVRGFNKVDTNDDERFSTLQSMLLYQLLGLFHRDEQQRLLANTFHGALVSMLRELDLPRKIRQAQLVTPHRLMPPSELDAAWKAWVKVETWRRVCFIVYLTDLETASTFNTSPFLPFSELTIDLPSSDALWNAGSAHEWLALITSPLNPTAVPFVDAIKVLLSPRVPAPFESGGILLAELARLSTFPLLILTRTLSFLQHKTEEAMKHVDPFRSLLGRFGMLEDRDQENRDVLARIIRGKETLRRLPGGSKRGEGTGWFEGVMPKGSASIDADFPRGPAPPPNADPTVSNEQDFVRKVQAKMDAMAKHAKRREKDLTDEYGGNFMAGGGLPPSF